MASPSAAGAPPAGRGADRESGGSRTLLSRELALVYASSFAGLTSFYLLLSVVPEYAAAKGAGGLGAGLATGALFFSTTLTELATPRLAAALGQRLAFALGLLLLGVPALALGAASGLGAIAGLCVLRGVGLAVVVVVGSALVPALVPDERRGEGLGLYGVVVGLPAVAALPLGLWLAARAGYAAVFVAAAAAALAGLAVLPRGAARAEVAPAGVAAALRTPGLVAPSFVFLTTALAAGAVVTFVPLAVPPALEPLAAPALLGFGLASTVTRWWAGRATDRHPALDLLRPGAVLAGLGMALLYLVGAPAALLAGTALVGAGFGVAQNASLTLMFDAAPRSEFDAVSAVWNLSYDAGLGAGGAGLGAVATRTGYPAGFALTAAAVLLALAAVGRSRHLVPGARRPA